jgi:hypothetical protein
MSDVACVRAWDIPEWKPYHIRLLSVCMTLETQGFKKRTGMTQNQKIIAHLKRAGSITQREAIIDYSIQSLTKRISELRHEGFKIVSKLKHHPITKQKYVRYELVK